MTIPGAGFSTAAGEWLQAQAAQLLAECRDAEQLAITLQPNAPVPRTGTDAEALDVIEGPRLRRFVANVDRALYGPRYRRMRRRRSRFAVVGQRGASGSLHWHGLGILERSKVERFRDLAASLWSEVAPAGSLDLVIDPDAGWARYATRHLVNGQPFIAHVLPELRQRD